MPDVVRKQFAQTAGALAQLRFDHVRRMMPSTIEHAVKYGVPMRVMEQATGRVVAYIEFEIIQAAAMLNVDERLNINEHQAPIIAEELYRMFPNESIEDIHLCFRNGVMGKYNDKLLRLDGAVLTDWMRKYLEEKYAESERQLMAEKDTYHPMPVEKPKADPVNPERNLLAALKIALTHHKTIANKSVEEVAALLKSGKLPADSPELEAQNNAKENAYQRHKMAYKPLSAEEIARRDLHLQYIRENYDVRTGQKLPTWVPEDEWLQRKEESEVIQSTLDQM